MATNRPAGELQWVANDVDEHAVIGSFALTVWPASGDSWQAWVSIPAAANTEGLPHEDGFRSTWEAKAWIAAEFRRFLQDHLQQLDDLACTPPVFDEPPPVVDDQEPKPTGTESDEG